MRRASGTLPLRHAIALGLAQGPTELLPISSSAHTALIPWMAGWPYASLDGQARKSFEVSLHAGAGLALAIAMRRPLARGRRMDRRLAGAVALSLLPPAIAGSALEGTIERRLGGPRSIARALAAGGAALAAADIAAGASGRRCADLRAADGLALGVAQAAALVPGISRNGATLTAARARGFSRRDADSLSWGVALPVIFGAGALKAWRAAREGVEPSMRAPAAAGAAAAFASTLAGARALGGPGTGGRGLLACSAYRCLLAAVVVRRLRRAQ